jgi:hypothetical protein
MQTGSSETLIGWKSGKTTCVPQWDRMKGAWLWILLGWICLFGVAVSWSNRPFMKGSLQLNKKGLNTSFVFFVAYLSGGDNTLLTQRAVSDFCRYWPPHTLTIKDRKTNAKSSLHNLHLHGRPSVWV